MGERRVRAGKVVGRTTYSSFVVLRKDCSIRGELVETGLTGCCLGRKEGVEWWRCGRGEIWDGNVKVWSHN